MSRINGQNKAAMISISFVVCLLFGILLYNGQKLEQRIEENEIKKAVLNVQIEEEEARTQEIYDLEEEMQTDEYIAGVAQNKLGLLRENEILFKPKK